MNKKIIILTIIVAIVVVGGILLRKDINPYSSQNQSPEIAGQENGNVVSIENFSFSPQTLTAPAGTKIVWKHNDAASHTIVSDDGLFESDVLTRGGEFSFVFDKAGEYPYHCGIHSSMKGKIIIQ